MNDNTKLDWKFVSIIITVVGIALACASIVYAQSTEIQVQKAKLATQEQQIQILLQRSDEDRIQLATISAKLDQVKTDIADLKSDVRETNQAVQQHLLEK